MRHFIFVFLFAVLFSAPAYAAAPIGAVAASEGTVTLQRGGKTYKLPTGTKLFNGDAVLTSKGSFAKLLFNDDSLLTVGANSSFKLENYAVTATSRSASFRLMFGKVRAIVSKFASGNTDYKFVTPTAVAGVRGTHLVLDFDQSTKQTTLSVIEGEVGFRGIDGKLETTVGTQQRSSSTGENASAPSKLTPEDNKKLNDEIAKQSKEKSSETNTAASSGDDKQKTPDATPAETNTADAGAEDALQRVDQTGVAGQGGEGDRQLPSENPAADTGIRVRW